MSGIEMESEYELIHTMQELVHMKEEYVKVQAALEAVRGTGYGVVVPNLDEIEIAQPEVIRQGNKYGVKIKSKSPSIHMIKANIETEIAPIVGTEQQAKDLIQYIDEGSQRGRVSGRLIFSVNPLSSWYRMASEARLQLSAKKAR